MPTVDDPRPCAPDERDPAHSQAARRIAEEILTSGPMTFRTFMERALYLPGSGYYARDQAPWTGAADYVTAPQVHSAVGAALARLAEEADAALEAPDCFDVVEFGGGDGTLMSDFIDALSSRAPRLWERLRVWCIERGRAARELQRGRLAEHGSKVRYLESLDQIPAAELRGLVMSNELLDAFAVHRVVRREGELHELYVDVESDAFVERMGPLSTERLAEHIAFNGIDLAEGQVAEICLAAAEWLEQVASRLRSGFVLTIDYGAETSTLYGPGRMEGSLVCQRRYQLSDDPLERVGEQDITAHVDFGNLRRRGTELGLETVGEAGLAVFLVGFGAAEGASLPDTKPGDGVAALSDHLGLRHLLFTEIGDAHRVLLQAKQVRRPIRFGVDRLG